MAALEQSELSRKKNLHQNFDHEYDVLLLALDFDIKDVFSGSLLQSHGLLRFGPCPGMCCLMVACHVLIEDDHHTCLEN